MLPTVTDLVSGSGDRMRMRTALRQLQVPQLLDRLAAADPGPEHQADVQTLRDFLK